MPGCQLFSNHPGGKKLSTSCTSYENLQTSQTLHYREGNIDRSIQQFI